TDDSVANGRITGATVSWSRDRRFESAAAAAVDPTGREIAVLGRRELASTQPLRIQIGAVRGGPVRSVVVAALHANGPPVWVAGGHVVLRALTDAGGDRFVVVDPKTGHSELVRLDAIDLFASGDGGTVGIVDDDGIRVVAAGDVESGAPGTRLRLGASADGLHVATAALDAQGQRIAFVLEDDDQRPIAIRVAAASSGWAAMQQIAVPRGARLVRLAWSG
ncbi:MAG TPA: hypothetical protein VGK63_11260, partial [Candidatus Limnocylindrales bacterium]